MHREERQGATDAQRGETGSEGCTERRDRERRMHRQEVRIEKMNRRFKGIEKRFILDALRAAESSQTDFHCCINLRSCVGSFCKFFRKVFNSDVAQVAVLLRYDATTG
jgi:hypothetical protein